MRLPSRVTRILDDLSGRSYRNILGRLERQLETCLDGAQLAGRLAAGASQPSEARAEMMLIEQAGDSERIDLTHQLFVALTTPMDREDLYQFSRAVDDVLDNLRDYVRESDYYGVERHPAATAIFDIVAVGLRKLRDGVGCLRDQPGLARERAIAARALGNQVRRQFLSQMSALYAEPVGIDMLKRRELLHRLDLVGQHMADAADALSHGLLKRSH